MKVSLTLALIVSLAWGVGLPLAPGQATRPTATKPASGRSSPESKINMDQVNDLLDKAREANTRGNEAETTRYLSELTQMARGAGDLRQYDYYENIFLRILKVKNDYPDALFGLAEYYRRTNPAWAIDYYTRYIQINPNDPNAYYGRGTCYLARDMNTLAIQDLQYLVDRLEPNNVGGLVNLALALRARANEMKGDPDKFKQAVEYMRRGVQAAQDSKDPVTKKRIPEFLYKLGVMTFEYEQMTSKASAEKDIFNESLEMLNLALQSAKGQADENPEDLQAWDQVIQCYDALANIYNTLSQRDPKDPVPLIHLAELTGRKADVQNQMTIVTILGYYKKALKLDPKAVEYWVLLAKTYRRLGRTNDALEAINKAVNLAPDNAEYKKWRTQWTVATKPAATRPATTLPATQPKR